MAQQIRHLGTVESIEGSHLRVRIVQASACASCAGRQLCRSAESKEKIVDIEVRDAASFVLGEQVMVVGTLSQGLRAAVWAYIVPLLLILFVLAVVLWAGGGEVTAALSAFVGLTVYYLILYRLRARLAQTFSFSCNHLKH